MELNLTRPLLFFDIESTGLNIPTDSIIELSFVKILPSGEQRIKTWKIFPCTYIGNYRPSTGSDVIREVSGKYFRQVHINPEASKVNGVTDDMLLDCPSFYEAADEIAEWLKDSDLAGFNSAKFDLPMLAEEFERAKAAGKDLHIDLHEPLMVDVQNIFHTMEPRNLKAAYRFYCGGQDFENAHTAEADTLATYEVLKAQLDRYDVLKNDVKELSKYVARKYVDFNGTLIYDDKGEVLINIGKHKGKPARYVFEHDRSYFNWVQAASFSLDTKACFAKLEKSFNEEKKKALNREATQEELFNLASKFNQR